MLIASDLDCEEGSFGGGGEGKEACWNWNWRMGGYRVTSPLAFNPPVGRDGLENPEDMDTVVGKEMHEEDSWNEYPYRHD